MLQFGFIVPTLIVLAALVLWILHQRRQIQRFREETERIRHENEAVIALMDNVGERMTRKINLDETLEVIVQFFVEATKAESGAIFLLDEVEQILQAHVIVGEFPPMFDDPEIAAARGDELNEKIRMHRIRVDEGIIGTVAQQESPLLIADAEADPRIPRLDPDLHPLHSLLLCPFRARGRSLGVLVMVNKQGDALFDEHDTHLLKTLADQAAITVDLVKLHDLLGEQRRLEQELEIAREFQTMLLPRQCPDIEGYEFGALNESALTVGGDFYDFFPIDEGHWGIVIGDVSGKGIPGSLIMAMVRSIIRAEAGKTLSPREALRRANERIRADTQDSVFVTIIYGVLDTWRGRFRFVRAGHEPMLLRHEDGAENEISVIRPEGMAVGLMPQEIFDHVEEVDIELRAGDTVLLYTDGVIESVNDSADEYGRERLIRRFSENAGSAPAELLKGLQNDIHEFASGVPQHDDITMVAFRKKPEADSKGASGASEPGKDFETPLSQTA